MTEPIVKTKAAYVLGFDSGDHMLIEDAHVVYQGPRILYVGADWTGPVDDEIDCGDALILPGFIDLDALADIDHAILDSWSPPQRATGYQWSGEYFRSGRMDVFTADERETVREYALAQLIRHGVTTFMPIASEVHCAWAETFDDFVAVADITRRLGIRGYLGPSYRAGINVIDRDPRTGLPIPTIFFDEERGRAGIADAQRFLEYAATLDDDLVHGALLPCRIETMTPELMRATAELARRWAVPVRIHCLQTPAELAAIRATYGMRPVELLAQTGLLDTHILLPHGLFVGENSRTIDASIQDLDTLAAADATIVHCPLTSIRYGSILESFDRYRRRGIRIALGSDSYPPDLIRSIDYGNNLAKWIDRAQDAGSIADYFRALTIGGSAALRRTDIGRLEAGASADFVVAELGDFAMGIRDDPLRQLVMNGSARNISRSVIAGRTVMEHGNVLAVDQDSLATQAQRLFEKMRAAYSSRDHAHRPPDELFPPTFASTPSLQEI